MVFPLVLAPVSKQDVENHLIKLTNRLIKDITYQFAFIFEHKDIMNDRKNLLTLYNELRRELHSIIFNIKAALERLPERNLIVNTFTAILKDIVSIGYMVIHPSLTLDVGMLRNLINKTISIIHTNFILLVDLTEMEELKGDNRTRREYIGILNDILLLLERTRLYCPRVNIYNEQNTISLARTASVNQIKFSEEYQKTFFFESVRVASQSMKDIIHNFHRSLYGYNQKARDFLKNIALKLNTELVNFVEHLANFIKSKDNEIYETIGKELSKFFEIWNNIIQWIVDSTTDNLFKFEAENEEVVTFEGETGRKSLSEMLETNMKITEALVAANGQQTVKISQEDELIEQLKGRCKIGDIDLEFEEYGPVFCPEVKRRFISDYILLSCRFIREVNVLFGN